MHFLRSNIGDDGWSCFFVRFAFSGRLAVPQVPESSGVPEEKRLNLIYESHPAETQVDGLPRAASLNCSRSCGWFEFPSNWVAQLFMENRTVLARGSGTFVFDKLWLDQGRHGGTIFHGSTQNLDFLAHFR